jgi:UDP-N-acetylglucosamine 2-epimerase (non-hydrolysing)
VQQQREARHLHDVTQHADDHVPAGLAPRRRVPEHRAEAIIARSVQAPFTVLSVVGTRPNFMKIAPVVAALAERGDAWRHVLVHTGQHYDDAMSRIFLEELGVGEPDHLLGVGSGSHAQQTARVMERLEPVLLEAAPDVVLVPGDVNSTLAATLVAAKLGIRVGHVEAGLRSFDRTMPEELNRIVTDSLSELLFIHSPEARDHLLREGADPASIHDVGNTMIDTLVAMRDRIDATGAPARHGLERGGYLVVTLHRPALVDGPLLATALDRLAALSRELPVVFPAHPRTRAAMAALDLPANDIRLLEPLGYMEFLSLVASAAGVLTDSGGIQEETTYLGVPCMTLRDNTERPVTVELGTNTLLGLAPERISEVPALLAQARQRPARIPPGWDGHAAQRIVDVLAQAQPASSSSSSAMRAAISPRS